MSVMRVWLSPLKRQKIRTASVMQSTRVLVVFVVIVSIFLVTLVALIALIVRNRAALKAFFRKHKIVSRLWARDSLL